MSKILLAVFIAGFVGWHSNIAANASHKLSEELSFKECNFEYGKDTYQSTRCKRGAETGVLLHTYPFLSEEDEFYRIGYYVGKRNARYVMGKSFFERFLMSL